VFTEPWGIPCNIKEPVIYQRWETGGMTGGSYHENSYLRPYKNENGKPPFKVLDLVLNELKPNLTYLQYKRVEELIKIVDESDRQDYYGNTTDYEISFILLSELKDLLETF
jgi:hypothetical protein